MFGLFKSASGGNNQEESPPSSEPLLLPVSDTTLDEKSVLDLMPSQSNAASSSSKLTEEQQAVLQVYQMKAMYELTTQLAGKCFDRCVPKLGTALDEKEKVCVNNCVARYFDMKLYFTRQLIHQE